MLVSIIIPIHKTHEFLKNCVESALAQTYSNIEVVLACNGTLEIKECQNFLDIQDARLIFIKTIQGRHNARNEALAITKGEWIQFLDYDDYLFPNKIEIQLSEVNACGFSICKWKKFTKNINEDYNFLLDVLFTKNQISSGELVQKLGATGGFIATASWLIYNELLTDLKWIDSPNDDAVFLSEILKKSPEISMLPEVLVGYRIHDSNTSAIRNKDEFDKLINGWKIIYNNLKYLEKATAAIYLFQAYLFLIFYSKQINKYRFVEVLWNCFYFGIKAKIGFLMYKEIFKNVVK